jgi:Na+/H+-dicarboxylate symporter
LQLFTQRNLTIALAASILLGILVGLVANGSLLGEAAAGPTQKLVQSVSIFGVIFMEALRMIVVPLVLVSVTTGVANLRESGQVGRKFGLVMAYFLATSFFAVFVGILYTNIVQPGAGGDPAALLANLPERDRAAAERTQQSIAERAPESIGAFVEVQVKNLLMNPFKSLAEMNLVGVVAFSMMLGLALAAGGRKSDPVIDFFNSMDHALMKLVGVVMWLAPLGIFALASRMIASLGLDVIGPLASYFITVVLGLGTMQLLVYPLLAVALIRYNPLKFLWGLREVMLLAVSTSSSAATMPVTIHEVQDKLGVDEGSANFVIPIGTTINMNGTALYEAVAAMFVAQLIGIEMSLTTQVLIFFTATLAAIGAAGVPQAGLVTMVIVFNAVGIPLQWMALIIVVDRPLDHLRTVVNVSGDALGAMLMSHRAGLLGKAGAAPETQA